MSRFLFPRHSQKVNSFNFFFFFFIRETAVAVQKEMWYFSIDRFVVFFF